MGFYINNNTYAAIWPVKFAAYSVKKMLYVIDLPLIYLFECVTVNI